MPEARRPDAGALVHPAPRDRMVGAHRGHARAERVALLVERHQHVMRAAHVRRERVVLVAEAVAVGQVAGRRVVAVGDLDGREVVGVGRRVARHQRADRAVARCVPPRPRRPRRRPSSPMRASPRCRRRRGRTSSIAACSASVNSRWAGRVVAVERGRLPEEDRVVLREVRGREDRGVADRRVAAARQRAGAGARARCTSGSRSRCRRRAAGLDQLDHRGLDRLAGAGVAVARRPRVDEDLRRPARRRPTP